MILGEVEDGEEEERLIKDRGANNQILGLGLWSTPMLTSRIHFASSLFFNFCCYWSFRILASNPIQYTIKNTIQVVSSLASHLQNLNFPHEL